MRAAHEAAEAEYRRALDNIEKRKNTLWCYVAMVLDTTSLMLIRHDCVDNKGFGDDHKAWILLHERFRSNKTLTVVIVMSKLTRITLKDDEALPQYFIRAQEFVNTFRAVWAKLVRATTLRNGFQRSARMLRAFEEHTWR